MQKVKFKDVPNSYEYFSSLARKEGWTGFEGLKEFAKETFNAKLHKSTAGYIHAIVFTDVEGYNKFFNGFNNSVNLRLL